MNQSIPCRFQSSAVSNKRLALSLRYGIPWARSAAGTTTSTLQRRACQATETRPLKVHQDSDSSTQNTTRHQSGGQAHGGALVTLAWCCCWLCTSSNPAAAGMDDCTAVCGKGQQQQRQLYQWQSAWGWRDYAGAAGFRGRGGARVVLLHLDACCRQRPVEHLETASCIRPFSF